MINTLSQDVRSYYLNQEISCLSLADPLAVGLEGRNVVLVESVFPKILLTAHMQLGKASNSQPSLSKHVEH